MRSELAVPVIYAGEVLAVICVDNLLPNCFTGEIDQLSQDVDYRDPSVSSYRLGNIIGNPPKAQQLIEMIQVLAPPLCQRLSL